MSTPTHKPRKKKKGDSGILANPRHGTVIVNPEDGIAKPAFPLVAFLWPAKGTVSQWVVLPLILIAVGLFRWATAFWGYSGYQKPPMHGDFEAQRHWLEITAHLPVSQCGHYIEPLWFALHTSRGLDDPTLKIFMRATVFISEYLVYIPAVVICLRRYSRLQEVNTWEYSIALVAILMQPGSILIDHGHFQYNTVMLGLVLASMSRAWTMYPLLKRDELSMPYFILTLLWAYLLGLPPTSLSIFRNDVPGRLSILEKLIHAGLYTAMIGWHFVEAFVPTPEGKPDLWVVANVLVGAPGFYVCYLWCLFHLIKDFKMAVRVDEWKKTQ
ncbi:putative glucosyltransferase protein [Neofusicoccum parvum UCRNP2]|uniref:Alpha-1,3-glucosyltransferase n=1 Tax=Botryosphaeria parva (strain UCR-NP2) TaxID=1287680 RepID=R1GI47_BOTPV|nr:putative glucosyltransferase protein [Neofusicoccum parvum UCRNP2]